MKKQYHREITSKALGLFFHQQALEEIIVANLEQDALRYQVAHDHFHYDSNSFAAGDAYCKEQRHLTLTAVQDGRASEARQAFGRLTHTVQDLYAHSNYVALWREENPGILPDGIDPESAFVLQNARLHSGKLYYPLEALSFIPVLNSFMLPLLPKDSHAWMNLDDPGRPGFDFALAAAIKRTRSEYEQLAGHFSKQEVSVLTGK